eukprot:1158866-Pelagomonas_calceolata.AAC.6
MAYKSIGGHWFPIRAWEAICPKDPALFRVLSHNAPVVQSQYIGEAFAVQEHRWPLVSSMGKGDYSSTRSCTVKGPATECPWNTESVHRGGHGLQEHGWPLVSGSMGYYLSTRSCIVQGPVTECPCSTESVHRGGHGLQELWWPLVSNMGMGDHLSIRSCTVQGPVTECPWNTESAHRGGLCFTKALVAIGFQYGHGRPSVHKILHCSGFSHRMPL